MHDTIDIDGFCDSFGKQVIVDVRSPSEFRQGHIPNAINIPLFEDDQRERVGTRYKQSGKQAATLLGLELVGPRMRMLAERAIPHASDKTIALHCWRGGMRSQSMAWLLAQVGLQPVVLEGGYKAFRRKAHAAFDTPRSMLILSGMTGCGKTEILHQIAALKEQVIDLEGLANHRGSAFGGIGMPAQPTTEQFENDLFMAILNCDPDRPIWVEDESPSIGRVRIPSEFWHQMRQSPALFLEVDAPQRAKHLASQYGILEKDELTDAVTRLQKRLGGLAVQQSVSLIEAGRFEEAAQMLLHYYDKAYHHAGERCPRKNVYRLKCATVGRADAWATIAEDVITFARGLPSAATA